MADRTVTLGVDLLFNPKSFISGMNGFMGAKFANMMGEAVGAVAKFGAESEKVFREYNYQMAKVKAVTGASEGQFASMDKQIKALGATTLFSSKQIAESAYFMGQAGWDTQQILAGLPAVTNLAIATGEDLAKTGSMVTDYLNAFGMEADQATYFTDILTQASVKSNASVTQLAESFKYSAGLSAEMGLDMKTLSKYLGLMANAGIKGSKAGSAMRNVLTRLASEEKPVVEAMKTLGVTAFDSAGQMRDFDTVINEMRGSFTKLSDKEKAVVAQNIATKQGMAGFLAIMSASTEEVNNLETALTNANGATVRMKETMQDTSEGTKQNFESSLETLQLSIGEALAPAINKSRKAMTNLFNEMTGNAPTAMDKLYKSTDKYASESLKVWDGYRKEVVRTQEALYSDLLSGENSTNSLEALLKAEDALLKESLSVFEKSLEDKQKAYQSYKDWLTKQGVTPTDQKDDINRQGAITGKRAEDTKANTAKIQELQKKLPSMDTNSDEYRKATETIYKLEQANNKMIYDEHMRSLSDVAKLDEAVKKQSFENQVAVVKDYMKQEQDIKKGAIETETNNYLAMQSMLLDKKKSGAISEQEYLKQTASLTMEHNKRVGESIESYGKLATEAQKSLGETTFEYDAYGNRVANVNDDILLSMKSVSEMVGTKMVEDYMKYTGVGVKELRNMDEATRQNTLTTLTSLVKTATGLDEASARAVVYSGYLQRIPKNIHTTVTITEVRNYIQNVQRNLTETYKKAFPAFTNSLGGTLSPIVPNASGGIFNGKVQLGNQLFGEAGKEAVLPLTNENAMKPFAQAVANNMGSNGQTVINIQNMTVRQEQDIKKIAKELDILRQTKSMARR